ncbi:hypothetical protein QTA57_00430 [Fontisubflavum oceani]|uniref:hypothetical protein n=1 Tax=Fontisubflavum oceani TaxID=2978973 RepID=UPI0025B35AD2|nr:hypothetical protein [Fontisubflavum oceani]WJY21713.1 hypothetical protein QTA57_00430 [Fontisubflavum oceani]
MVRQRKELLTVTPPTLERFGFDQIDQALAITGPAMRRDWLLARFQEGLQLRMLRTPDLGLIAFTPGRAAWVPIAGAEEAVVVHDLRVGAQSTAPETVRRLWTAVEEWARFYGFSSVLALSGSALGLIPPDMITGRRYVCLDEGPGKTRLMGKVLRGRSLCHGFRKIGRSARNVLGRASWSKAPGCLQIWRHVRRPFSGWRGLPVWRRVMSVWIRRKRRGHGRLPLRRSSPSYLMAR